MRSMAKVKVGAWFHKTWVKRLMLVLAFVAAFMAGAGGTFKYMKDQENILVAAAVDYGKELGVQGILYQVYQQCMSGEPFGLGNAPFVCKSLTST